MLEADFRIEGFNTSSSFSLSEYVETIIKWLLPQDGINRRAIWGKTTQLMVGNRPNMY